MSWSKKHPMTFVLTAAIAVTVGLVGVSSLRADGVPEMNTLAYTGRLVEDGVPVDGMRDIRVTLWSHPDSTDAATYRLCRVVPAADTLVQDGYFRIPLDVDDDTCETAVTDNSDVWVEVAVEGTTLSPRTQIAAVPYALEANRASSAAGDLRRELDEFGSSVRRAAPVGAVSMWFTPAAPSGWLMLDGRTIGNAGSGATALADSSTQELFTLLWENFDNSVLPIENDAGAPTTRGSTPEDDFMANRRLPLPNATGLVPRGAGRQSVGGSDKVGPALGTVQVDQMQGHWHAVRRHSDNSTIAANAGGGNYTWSVNTLGGMSTLTNRAEARDLISDGTHGGPRIGSETRPAAFGVNFIIKL